MSMLWEDEITLMGDKDRTDAVFTEMIAHTTGSGLYVSFYQALMGEDHDYMEMNHVLIYPEQIDTLIEKLHEYKVLAQQAENQTK